MCSAPRTPSDKGELQILIYCLDSKYSKAPPTHTHTQINPILDDSHTNENEIEIEIQIGIVASIQKKLKTATNFSRCLLDFYFLSTCTMYMCVCVHLYLDPEMTFTVPCSLFVRVYVCVYTFHTLKNRNYLGAFTQVLMLLVPS